MSEIRLPLPQRPDGFVGRAFGVVMELLNERSYHATLRALGPTRGRVLEIGYGTGRLLELLLNRNTDDCQVSGVDPSPTMNQVTLRRLAKCPSVDPSEIRIGSDFPLNWPSGHFDVVLAVHSFQFWSHPEQTLDELSRVLARPGRALFVLRAHRSGTDWLPNPMSRAPDEAASLTAALTARGLTVRKLDPSGSSRLLYASNTAQHFLSNGRDGS